MSRPMNTAALIQMERGLWTGGDAWIRATALPSSWFVMPEPLGVIGIDAMEQIAHTAPKGFALNNMRMEQLAEDVILAVYRASTTASAEVSEAYVCSSTYVLHRRRWRLAHHQRTPTAAN